MRNGLPAFHDPDNGRLRFVITIRSYTLVRLLILLFGFFGLDLVDLDAIPWVRKVEIHSESVGVPDVFTSWLFAEDAILSAGKGLERPFEFGVVYSLLAGPLEGTRVTQDSGLITHQG